MFPEPWVTATEDGVVAVWAAAQRGGPDKTRVKTLHSVVISVAKRREYVEQAVVAGEFSHRTGVELVFDRSVTAVRLNPHIVILPLPAAPLSQTKRTVHQLPEYLPVAVHEAELLERVEEKLPVHPFDFLERGHLAADDIIAEHCDAVIGSAQAVVKILPAAQVGAVVPEIVDKLPLHG